MNLLNALLAFCVTMLIFSTMTLVVVEVFHRFNHTREKYFELMVSKFFDELIWPKIRGLIEVEGKPSAQYKAEFLQAMLSVSGLPSLDIEQRSKGDKLTYHKSKSADKTTERLDAVEFCQRLARTQAGVTLLDYSEDKARVMILDLARNLESISTGATSNFRVKSRFLSLLAAIPLVVFFNIDAIHIFRTYAANPAIAEAVADIGHQAEERYIETAQALETVKTELANTNNSEGKVELEALLSTTQSGVKKIKASLAGLKEEGVPMGWQHFPGCFSNANNAIKDIRCTQGAKEAGPLKLVAQWVGWLMGLASAIFLIGQGAPFWFEMFQKITWLMQVAKGLGLGRKLGKEVDRAEAEVHKEQAMNGSKAIDPVDAFMVAATAKKLELAGES